MLTKLMGLSGVMNSCIELHFNNETEWHKIRSNKLGGSDIGTLLGFNKYKTAYELWQEKTGKVQPQDISNNPAIIRGKAAERHLIGLFAANNPNLIVEEGNRFTYQSKERNYAIANIDGLINKDTILEIKTATIRSWEDWKDQIPMTYYCQVMWYMYVTGLRKAKLYAMLELINFDETKENDFYLKTYEINYNKEEMEFILKETDKFMEKVRSKEWNEFTTKINI